MTETFLHLPFFDPFFCLLWLAPTTTSNFGFMGGPCNLIDAKAKRKLGPNCTDNFQVRPFEYAGRTYFSCEHAYQAAKFPLGSDAREAADALRPHGHESDRSFGMRCWKAGNVGNKSAEPRPDWAAVKVDIMYEVNASKCK